MSTPIKGFYIYSRSWYAQAGHPKEIMIGLYHPEGGCTAEFGIRWFEQGGRSVPRLEIFDDAWKFFFQLQELRALAQFDQKNATEQQIVDFLLKSGFTDLTKYDGPKPQKPTITVTIEGGIVQDVTGIPAGYELHVEDHDESDESHTSWSVEKECFVTVYEGDANG
jgi:hypothetical protein